MTRRRDPKPPTRDKLVKAAVAYAQRHGGTRRRVTDMLERKVRQALRESEDEAALAEALAWVPEIVDSLEEGGVLDDGLYGQLLARSLHRSGRSRRMIRARLAQKGVAPEDAERAVALLELESPDMDREAALEFARKRRFGAYRRADVLFDDARRKKELGAFARAGHRFELAKSLVDATSEPDDE